MEFGMSRRIKPREICEHFNEGNLDGPSKNKELWSYVMSFEFSRPKVAQYQMCYFTEYLIERAKQLTAY